MKASFINADEEVFEGVVEMTFNKTEDDKK